MKQNGGGSLASLPVSSWQLEEAQVFWAKGEQGLALGLLRQMIHVLEEEKVRTNISTYYTYYPECLSEQPRLCDRCCVYQVDFNPALAPVYTESLRLCGNWLAETCLESPGVILEKYLERVRRGSEPGLDPFITPVMSAQRETAHRNLFFFLKHLGIY